MHVNVRKQDGKWRAVVSSGQGKQRKQRTKSTGVPCNSRNDCGRRKAIRIATDWAESIRDEMDLPKGTTSARVDEYCTGYIDSLLATGQIERSTRRGYSTYLNYISDFFSDYHMDDVKAPDVERFVIWLKDDKSLAQNSVKKAFNVLSACFKHAVLSRELHWNPCDPVKTPRQEKKLSNPLTDESREKFLKMMDGLQLSQEVMGIWIAYYTGCRRGEVAHLRWSDITIASGEGSSYAVVSDAVGIGQGGAYEKDTKGHNTRIVPLPSKLVSLLAERKAIMVDECIFAGIAFQPDLFVCGSIDGRWINPPRLTKWWSSHRTEWGLMGVQGRPPVLHDLRHTYATIAVRNMDLMTAKDIMGHKDIQTTIGYAATDLSHVTKAGKAMSSALG